MICPFISLLFVQVLSKCKINIILIMFGRNYKQYKFIKLWNLDIIWVKNSPQISVLRSRKEFVDVPRQKFAHRSRRFPKTLGKYVISAVQKSSSKKLKLPIFFITNPCYSYQYWIRCWRMISKNCTIHRFPVLLRGKTTGISLNLSSLRCWKNPRGSILNTF